MLSDPGTSPINGWQLAWTFPGDQKISQLWTATYTQTARRSSTTSPTTRRSQRRHSVTIGFTGTFTNSDTSPSSFSVNGSACT